MHDVGLHATEAAVVRARGPALPRVVVVSGGANDDPRIPSAFSRAASRIVAAAGPGRCVVWPTIVRPPAAGAGYGRLNRVLGRLARRHGGFVVVDWVALVRRNPSWLAPDGVHVTPRGIGRGRRRSPRRYARAAPAEPLEERGRCCSRPRPSRSSS